MKLAVYTALFTDNPDYLYGDIIHYQHDKNGIDYIAFTNSDYLESDFWDIRKIDIWRNGRWTARKCKTSPEELLPEYDAWLWMDNQIYFTVDPLSLANFYLNDSDIAIHTHCDRNCIYEEVIANLNRNGKLRDPREIIISQGNSYMDDGYPESNGLYESGILFRRNNENVIQFNEMWFDELSKWTCSDQISLPYVIWKLNNIKLNVINKTFVAHKPIKKLDKTDYFFTLPRTNRYVKE